MAAPKSAIAAINAAARRCGMSYGQYVAATGGLLEAPQDLLLRHDPRAKRCPHCNSRFLPAGRNQRYCSARCRKAAHEAKKQA